MKANVTLKYRPLSDTVMAYVDGLLADSAESEQIPDISNVRRERVDADTLVEWSMVDGKEYLVGVQQMHASVRPHVEGIPSVIGVLVTELVLVSRDADSDAEADASPASLLRTFEMQHVVDLEQLLRPITITAPVRATKATTKAVEAALHHMIDSAEAANDDAMRSSIAALRDLALSIGDGEGLSSARSAEATFQTISQSNMRSRRQQQVWLNVVNDLRDQRTWSRAIEAAMESPDVVSEVDAASDDD
jgi:hypothetical protein